MCLKWFARIVGVVFLLIGALGFFMDHLFGMIHFDGLHNVIHLIVGAAGLLAARDLDASRKFARILGIVYVVIGIMGLFAPQIFGMEFEATENIIHLVVGAIGLALGYLKSN